MMIASAAKPGAVPRKREVPPGHHHRTSDDRKRGEAGRSPPQAGGAPRSLTIEPVMIASAAKPGAVPRK
ncbi:hypothetical protein TMDG_00121, partial [Mycobacterium tuberculosis SUMu004]